MQSSSSHQGVLAIGLPDRLVTVCVHLGKGRKTLGVCSGQMVIHKMMIGRKRVPVEGKHASCRRAPEKGPFCHASRMQLRVKPACKAVTTARGGRRGTKHRAFEAKAGLVQAGPVPCPFYV